MGRTQRQRRIEQAANELQAHIEEANQVAAVAAIPDEQLFVIDRVGELKPIQAFAVLVVLVVIGVMMSWPC